jgi:hypothetical protein
MWAKLRDRVFKSESTEYLQSKLSVSRAEISEFGLCNQQIEKAKQDLAYWRAQKHFREKEVKHIQHELKEREKGNK